MNKIQKNVLSNTSLKSRIKKKTDPRLATAIFLAIKNPAWLKFAKILSQSTKKHSSVNLEEIDKQTSLGDTVLVPGKVLSVGDITKKIRICSFGISKEALERLTKTKSEWVSILDEIKKNPKAEGLKIIR
ncbi:MAG TPA: 50S ribosomal protein L18e [Candidatus Nanoarchaeia archaeon]|nr:50S ribosomal protein L18e [Candidatus Nanoarchaeia archaeon]